MNHLLLDSYYQFVQAIARGDVITSSRMVNKAQFRAVLPGGPASGIDFTIFVPEMERQRAAFSDFGQNVVFHNLLVHENHVAAYYTMTLTYDGELSSWRGDSLPPSGRTVLLNAADFVTFDTEGLITELVTLSDRLTTIRQM
jgi:hypothetical protein